MEASVRMLAVHLPMRMKYIDMDYWIVPIQFENHTLRQQWK